MSSNKDLLTLSMGQLSAMIKDKIISPVELVEATLESISSVDEKINAYITVMEDTGLSLAKKAEESIMGNKYLGPLHGIPLAVKDNIDIQGVPTTSGSKIHQNFIPKANSPVMTRLLKAGMIPIGKTNLHEYALGVTTVNPHHNSTNNPWDLNKIAGGSSGGSAAALAADIATVAIGTDTAGSIRIPSACCGTVGLKPTFNRVGKQGVFPVSQSLDHVGPMTKTVQDAYIMLKEMSKYNDDFKFENDELETDNLKGIKVGILDDHYDNVDSCVLSNMRKVEKQLINLDAEIQTVSLSTLEYLSYSIFVLMWVESSFIHHNELITQEYNFGHDVKVQLKLGKIITGEQYLIAQRLRGLIVKEITMMFKSIDILLLPTTPFPAPVKEQTEIKIKGKDYDVTESLVKYTSIASIGGFPAISIPSGIAKGGMPTGIQFVGGKFDEKKLIQTAYFIEQLNYIEKTLDL